MRRKNLITEEAVINRIYHIRNRKVMIDSDLAELYGVPTRRLNEQVKRNMKRFPVDFMFQLTSEEKQLLIERHPHLHKLKYSSTMPFAFTEHGAVMLASVLNSETAIAMNVHIVRIFIRMRELGTGNRELLLKLERIEKRLGEHDDELQEIFRYLKALLNPDVLPAVKIGFRRQEEV